MFSQFEEKSRRDYTGPDRVRFLEQRRRYLCDMDPMERFTVEGQRRLAEKADCIKYYKNYAAQVAKKMRIR
jgi:hypothetical protein